MTSHKHNFDTSSPMRDQGTRQQSVYHINFKDDANAGQRKRYDGDDNDRGGPTTNNTTLHYSMLGIYRQHLEDTKTDKSSYREDSDKQSNHGGSIYTRPTESETTMPNSGLAMNAAVFEKWNLLKAKFHGDGDFRLFEHLIDIHEKFCSQCSECEKLPNARGDTSIPNQLLAEHGKRDSVEHRDLKDRPRKNWHRDDDDDDDKRFSGNLYRQNFGQQRNDVRSSRSRSPSFRLHGPSDSDGNHYRQRQDTVRNDSIYNQNDSTRSSTGHIDKERNSLVASTFPILGIDRDFDITVPTSSYHQRKNLTMNTNLMDPQQQERIVRRKKNIAYGKNTDSYKRYIAVVPRNDRDPNSEDHPTTPDIWQHCSRRTWDSQLKHWKKSLHNAWSEGPGLSSQSHPALTTSLTQDHIGVPTHTSLDRNQAFREIALNDMDNTFF